MPESVRILLVDDDEAIVQILQEALAIQGYEEVACACDGKEAVQAYDQVFPDLVFMDISMPVMDGYEASRRIKAMDPDARIVVLTGNPGDSRALRIMDEGIARTVIQKPIRLKHLQAIIEAEVSGSENLDSSPSSPFLPHDQQAFEPRL